MAGSTQNTPTERRSESRNSVFLRKCHEKNCNTMTTQYRCPKCKAKHLEKNRGNMEGFAADETYSVLH
jgi:cytochrome c-type biogenesis protein CcmH/NrfF